MNLFIILQEIVECHGHVISREESHVKKIYSNFALNIEVGGDKNSGSPKNREIDCVSKNVNKIGVSNLMKS